MSTATPTRRAHVLIASDRLPTRVGLRLALEPEARCTEAADADAAVDAAVRYRPDVCLLGLDAKGQGLRVTNEIVSRVPSAVVILLTNRLDEEEFMAAVRAGASGYLTNSLDPARLPHVVRGRGARRAGSAAAVRLAAARRAPHTRAQALGRHRRKRPDLAHHA